MYSVQLLRDRIHLSTTVGSFDVKHAQNMQYSMLFIQPHDYTFQTPNVNLQVKL